MVSRGSVDGVGVSVTFLEADALFGGDPGSWSWWDQNSPIFSRLFCPGDYDRDDCRVLGIWDVLVTIGSL